MNPDAVAAGGARPARRVRHPANPVATPHVVGAAAAMAIALAALLSGQPRIVVAVPVAAAAALVCTRWPAPAVIGAFLLTGAAGSITAFTPLPVNQTIDLLLVGLWGGVAWQLVARRNDGVLWVWPGILLPVLYVALTAAAALLTSDSIGVGLNSFRLSGWHLLAFVLVAVAPWSLRTQTRIVRGVLLVILAVGAYAVFRKVVGPAQAEIDVARANAIGLQLSQPVRFTGSFGHPQDLGAWSACVIPFALALALAWRGRWQLVAVLAVAACTFGLLAADRRAATVGAVLGAATTLALFLFAARPFRGARIGAASLAIVGILGVGAVAYSFTIAQNPASADRFEGLLSAPAEEESYQIRLSRWSYVFESVDEYPFGRGLGETGAVARTRPDYDADLVVTLDSSYLKIAVEQGLFVLLLFAAAYLCLLAGLAWRALQTSSPRRAAVAIGACGTLAAMAPIFYASMLIERPMVVGAWLLVGLGAAQFTRVSTRRSA